MEHKTLQKKSQQIITELQELENTQIKSIRE